MHIQERAVYNMNNEKNKKTHTLKKTEPLATRQQKQEQENKHNTLKKKRRLKEKKHTTTTTTTFDAPQRR